MLRSTFLILLLALCGVACGDDDDAKTGNCLEANIEGDFTGSDVTVTQASFTIELDTLNVEELGINSSDSLFVGDELTLNQLIIAGSQGESEVEVLTVQFGCFEVVDQLESGSQTAEDCGLAISYVVTNPTNPFATTSATSTDVSITVESLTEDRLRATFTATLVGTDLNGNTLEYNLTDGLLDVALPD